MVYTTRHVNIEEDGIVRFNMHNEEGHYIGTFHVAHHSDTTTVYTIPPLTGLITINKGMSNGYTVTER